MWKKRIWHLSHVHIDNFDTYRRTSRKCWKCKEIQENRINFKNMEIQKCIWTLPFCCLLCSYHSQHTQITGRGSIAPEKPSKYDFQNFSYPHFSEIYSIFLGFPYIFNIFMTSFEIYQNYRYVSTRDAKFVFFTPSRTCIRAGSP